MYRIPKELSNGKQLIFEIKTSSSSIRHYGDDKPYCTHTNLNPKKVAAYFSTEDDPLAKYNMVGTVCYRCAQDKKKEEKMSCGHSFSRGLLEQSGGKCIVCDENSRDNLPKMAIGGFVDEVMKALGFKRRRHREVTEPEEEEKEEAPEKEKETKKDIDVTEIRALPLDMVVDIISQLETAKEMSEFMKIYGFTFEDYKSKYPHLTWLGLVRPRVLWLMFTAMMKETFPLFDLNYVRTYFPELISEKTGIYSGARMKNFRTNPASSKILNQIGTNYLKKMFSASEYAVLSIIYNVNSCRPLFSFMKMFRKYKKDVLPIQTSEGKKQLALDFAAAREFKAISRIYGVNPRILYATLDSKRFMDMIVPVEEVKRSNSFVQLTQLPIPPIPKGMIENVHSGDDFSVFEALMYSESMLLLTNQRFNYNSHNEPLFSGSKYMEIRSIHNLFDYVESRVKSGGNKTWYSDLARVFVHFVNADTVDMKIYRDEFLKLLGKGVLIHKD